MKRIIHIGMPVILIFAILMGSLSGCSTPASSQNLPQAASSAAEQPQLEASLSADSYESNKEYLRTYFDIDSDAAWDSASFSKALKTISEEEAAAVEGELTALSAIKAAVISASYDELAQSYPGEKTSGRMKLYDLKTTGDDTMDAYLVCGVDAKLYTPEQAVQAVGGGQLDKKLAAALLMNVAEAQGKTRNYLGYSDDPEMDARLEHTWNSFLIFDDPELTEIGLQAVGKQITTGYNLKSSVYDARFLPGLTLQYGHSDIKHAHQLMVLLASEGLVAKVQLEPKISVFQYLLEWGPVPEPTPTYEVRQFADDLYLVFAVEYDLQLEFDTLEEMRQFNNVITTYAKKYEGNEEAVGLIFGSWWQPLYTTTRNDMPKDEYYKIHDCVIRNGEYSIHPFCLDEDLDKTVAALNAINPDFRVQPETRYCNLAFYNYMKGDDFQ